MTERKYLLKITNEEEYEAALSELENDIEQLRGQLERKINSLKNDDKLQKTTEYLLKTTNEKEYEVAMSELEHNIEQLRKGILTNGLGQLGQLERNINRLKNDDKLQKTTKYLWSDAYKRDVLDKKYN